MAVDVDHVIRSRSADKESQLRGDSRRLAHVVRQNDLIRAVQLIWSPPFCFRAQSAILWRAGIRMLAQDVRCTRIPVCERIVIGFQLRECFRVAGVLIPCGAVSPNDKGRCRSIRRPGHAVQTADRHQCLR